MHNSNINKYSFQHAHCLKKHALPTFILVIGLNNYKASGGVYVCNYGQWLQKNKSFIHSFFLS